MKLTDSRLVTAAVIGSVLVWLLWWRTTNNNYKKKKSTKLTDEQLQFLAKYTQETDLKKLRKHVIQFMEKDLVESGLHVYPCIERMRFLTPSIQQSKTFQEMIKRKDDAMVLEIGCGLGQETRSLIHEGFPPRNIIVTDLHKGYWNLGKKLFMDEQTIQVNGVFGDFATQTGGINLQAYGLVNRFDFAFAYAVLHCLSQTQIEAFLKNVLQVLKAGSNAKFFGWCLGRRSATLKVQDGRHESFLHTSESLEELLQSTGFANTKVSAGERGKGDASPWEVILRFSARKP